VLIALLGAFIAGGGFVPGFRVAMIVAAAAYVLAVVIATRVPSAVDDADRERVAQLIES
jgi:hypothetical protein